MKGQITILSLSLFFGHDFFLIFRDSAMPDRLLRYPIRNFQGENHGCTQVECESDTCETPPRDDIYASNVSIICILKSYEGAFDSFDSSLHFGSVNFIKFGDFY